MTGWNSFWIFLRICNGLTFGLVRLTQTRNPVADLPT